MNIATIDPSLVEATPQYFRVLRPCRVDNSAEDLMPGTIVDGSSWPHANKLIAMRLVAPVKLATQAALNAAPRRQSAGGTS